MTNLRRTICKAKESNAYVEKFDPFLKLIVKKLIAKMYCNENKLIFEDMLRNQFRNVISM